MLVPEPLVLFRLLPVFLFPSLSLGLGPVIPPPLRGPLEAKLGLGPHHHRLVASRQELNSRLSKLHLHIQRPVCAACALRLHSSFDLYQLRMTLSEKSRISSSRPVVDQSPPLGVKVNMNSLQPTFRKPSICSMQSSGVP